MGDEISVTTAVVAAVVTGAVTGLISSISTVSSLRVHIQYLRETLQRHDERLREVEREQREVLGLVKGKGPPSVMPDSPVVGTKVRSG